MTVEEGVGGGIQGGAKHGLSCGREGPGQVSAIRAGAVVALVGTIVSVLLAADMLILLLAPGGSMVGVERRLRSWAPNARVFFSSGLEHFHQTPAILVNLVASPMPTPIWDYPEGRRQQRG